MKTLVNFYPMEYFENAAPLFFFGFFNKFF